MIVKTAYHSRDIAKLDENLASQAAVVGESVSDILSQAKRLKRNRYLKMGAAAALLAGVGYGAHRLANRDLRKTAAWWSSDMSAAAERLDDAAGIPPPIPQKTARRGIAGAARRLEESPKVAPIPGSYRAQLKSRLPHDSRFLTRAGNLIKANPVKSGLAGLALTGIGVGLGSMIGGKSNDRPQY